jgi:hypothetical protein
VSGKPKPPSTIDGALAARGARDTKPKAGQEPGIVPVADADLPYKPGARVKVTVDGADKEIPIEEVVRDYQIRKASDQRFQEAAQMQKRVEKWIDDFNADPIGAMEKLSSGKEGAKFDEIVQRYLYRKLQVERMTPEQRESLQQQQELAQFRAAEQKRAQDAEAAKSNEAKAALHKRVQGQISTAMEAEGLPAEPEVARRIAELMLGAHRLQKTFYTARDAARDVRAKLLEEHNALVRTMSPEQLVKWLGKDAEKIRAYEVQQLRNPPATVLNTRSTGATKTPAGEKPINKYLTTREWEERMKSR